MIKEQIEEYRGKQEGDWTEAKHSIIEARSRLSRLSKRLASTAGLAIFDDGKNDTVSQT